MSEKKTFQGMSMHEMHVRMNAIRKGENGQLRRNITFSEFAREELGVEPEKVLYDMGVELDRMSVELLLAADPSSTWLLPEVFIEAITRGFKARPWYTNLIVREEMVDSISVNVPHVNIADTVSPAERGEGETVKSAEITYGDRDVKIRELARKIDLTYNAIRLHRLSFVAVFLEQFGVKLGQVMNARAVDRLVNGDQADGSLAPATIGVNSVQDGITYADLVRAFVRLGSLGYPADTVIATEDGINTLLNLEEFKTAKKGDLVKVNLLTPLPTDLKFCAHSSVGANKFLVGSSTAMAMQGTVFPLEVESDKIIAKRIEEAVASITTDIINVQRDARVIIDQSITYAANGFPTWMAAE